ncbi:MAG: EboA domain-containing protein [Rhodocyclaceae bacterium]|nr:EboA domain-containing protein [Rhodocyclaceae bacterium]
MEDSRTSMLKALQAECSAEAMAWLIQTCDALAGAGAPERLDHASAQCGRRLGRGAIAADQGPIATRCGPLSIAGRPVAELGRTCLIAAAAGAPDGSAQALVGHYRGADEAERAAVVRALAVIDAQGDSKPLALEAGRANSQVLLGAVMLGNPYPAAHYSEAEFDQMVLKALFVGMPLAGVVGLAARAGPGLSRMCEDYYDERIAAGREAPADIWLALAPHASERGESLLLDNLTHPNPRHRFFAIVAAGARAAQRPGLRDALRSRTASETDPSCLEATALALAH